MNKEEIEKKMLEAATDCEVWKDIKDYEGYYQVSNKGRVRRIRKYRKDVGVLKPALSVHGYPFVCLSKNDKRKSLVVHRMVAKKHFMRCGL